MGMNRRGFLGLLVGAAAVPLVPVPELLPAKTIFLPPRGGWHFGKYDVRVDVPGNQLLTPEMIARELLISIEQHLLFAGQSVRDYAEFIRRDQWSPAQQRVVNVRKPLRVSRF